MAYMCKRPNGVGCGPMRPSLIPRLVEWPVLPVQGATQIDSPTDDKLFEERAAIREFDAKLSREDAEVLARHDLAAGRWFHRSIRSTIEGTEIVNHSSG